MLELEEDELLEELELDDEDEDKELLELLEELEEDDDELLLEELELLLEEELLEEEELELEEAAAALDEEPGATFCVGSGALPVSSGPPSGSVWAALWAGTFSKLKFFMPQPLVANTTNAPSANEYLELNIEAVSQTYPGRPNVDLLAN